MGVEGLGAGATDFFLWKKIFSLEAHRQRQHAFGVALMMWEVEQLSLFVQKLFSFVKKGGY